MGSSIPSTIGSRISHIPASEPLQSLERLLAPSVSSRHGRRLSAPVSLHRLQWSAPQSYPDRQASAVSNGRCRGSRNLTIVVMQNRHKRIERKYFRRFEMEHVTRNHGQAMLQSETFSRRKQPVEIDNYQRPSISLLNSFSHSISPCRSRTFFSPESHLHTIFFALQATG